MKRRFRPIFRAALLLVPVLGFCVIRERLSWRPRVLAPMKGSISKRGVSALAWSPDGKWLACANDEAFDGGSLSVRDAKTNASRFRPIALPGALKTLQFTPDGRFLIGSAWAAGIFVWDAVNGKQLHRISTKNYGTPDLALSKDGSHLAVVARGRLEIWKLPACRKVAATPASSCLGRPLFDLNNRGVWCAGYQWGLWNLWDFAGKKIDERLLVRNINESTLNPYSTSSLRAMPNGKTVVISTVVISGDRPGVKNGRVEKRDWQTGRLLNTQLIGLALTMSPDGALLAGVSGQNVQLFDAEFHHRRTLVSPLNPLPNQILPQLRDLTFSPDSRTLAVGDSEDRVILWRVQ